MPSLFELALTLVPGIGSITARSLVDRFGTAEAVFKASASELRQTPGLQSKAVEGLLSKAGLNRAEQELRFIEKFHLQSLFITSPLYPKRLLNCCDAPVLLYYKGQADLNSMKVVSVVGTRNATDYGKELTRELVRGLKTHNTLVVSGLAYGIDIAAHKACLEEGLPTVGVVAHGLDRIYPAQHRQIAERMLASGGILTEFMSGSKPDRENFPKRNRIVAGMADATIVVEAGANGGALITADIANSYDRDVFAFPGRTTDPFSAGCNAFIRTNRAHLVTGIKDIEYILGWEEPEQKQVPSAQMKLPINLTGDERLLAEVLQGSGPMAIDDLTISTRLPLSRLSVALLNMEMQNIVCALPGKVYRLA